MRLAVDLGLAVQHGDPEKQAIAAHGVQVGLAGCCHGMACEWIGVLLLSGRGHRVRKFLVSCCLACGLVPPPPCVHCLQAANGITFYCLFTPGHSIRKHRVLQVDWDEEQEDAEIFEDETEDVAQDPTDLALEDGRLFGAALEADTAHVEEAPHYSMSVQFQGRKPHRQHVVNVILNQGRVSADRLRRSQNQDDGGQCKDVRVPMQADPLYLMTPLRVL